MVEAYGFDGTGKCFDELFGGERLATATRHCSVAFETAKPLFTTTTYSTSSKLIYRANRILLPLADDRGCVTKLMIGNALALGVLGMIDGNVASSANLDADRFDVLDEDPQQLLQTAA